MSHQPERKEKNCLNCGTIVQGRYCHSCGQENIETKTSLLGIIRHFFDDITHFDGKFFVTLKHLVSRPGFVPKEFVAGKRHRYIHPIRMYLFTSALFFLIFFSMNEVDFVGTPKNDLVKKEERKKLLNTFTEKLKTDSNNAVLKKKILLLADTTKPVSFAEIDAKPQEVLFDIDSTHYESLAEYDSIQQAKPADQRDGWLGRMFTRRYIEVNNRYEGDMNKATLDFIELFLHKMPYLFFLSLPFFAFFLKLFYFRHKNFYYSDHFTFIIYHFIFSYCLFIVIFSVAKLNDWLDWGLLNWMIFAMIVWWAVYFYKGLKNFYGQKRGKTLVKFILLNIAGYLLVLSLFLVLLVISVFQF